MSLLEDLCESDDGKSLMEHLDSQVEGKPTGDKKEFVVNSDELANWTVKQILMHQKRIEDKKALAKKIIDESNRWLAGQIESHNQSIEFFSGKLREYAQQFVTKRSKTVSYPAGNVSFHSIDPEFFIAGEKVSGKNKTLTERVEQLAPDLILTEKSTDWTEFKNTLTVMEDGRVISADGEVLDFIEAVEYPDKLSVKERK